MTDAQTAPDQEQETKAEELLVSEDIYLTSGVHIGTQQKSSDMQSFIFKVRSDGLYVLDVKQTDTRLRQAARAIARQDPDRVLVVSARKYGHKPVREFSAATGTRHFAGRFVPGTLTNPRLTTAGSSMFQEPALLIVTDPAADQQALKEAVGAGIMIIGLCDVNNETRSVDFVIPTNNKGRRALATVYWLLTRQVLKERGAIKSDSEFTMSIDDFEAPL